MPRVRTEIGISPEPCSLCGSTEVALLESRNRRSGFDFLNPRWRSQRRTYGLCRSCGARMDTSDGTQDGASSKVQPSTRGTRLDSLTGLRFFAALAVVLLHITASRANSDPLVDVGTAAGRVTELGYLGVTFFFTLSGFVLTWSASGLAVSPLAFYRRRFARVYPMHLLTALLAGAALVVAGSAAGLGAWVASLLLVQAWVPDSDVYFALNGVSWSLSCEAFFYAITPLLLALVVRRSTRACWAAVGALLAIMVAVTVFLAAEAPSRDQDVWVSPWFSVIAFVAGMTLALTVQRGNVRWPSLRWASIALIATLAVLLTLSWSDRWPRTAATLLILPSMVLLIGAAALRDLSGRRTWLARRSWVRLGEWSFALYLVHPLCIRAIHQVAKVPTLKGLSGVGGLVAIVVLAISCSGVAYSFVERPAERRLRGQRRAEASAVKVSGAAS